MRIRKYFFSIAYILIILNLLVFSKSYAATVSKTEESIHHKQGNVKSRVIISDYSITNKAITPGQKFDMVVTIKNPSKDSTIKSLLVTHSNDIESIYSIYGKSDQVFIEELKPLQEKKILFTFATCEEIKSAAVMMTWTFTYADEEFTNNQNVETVMLPMEQTSQLEIQAVSAPNSTIKNNKVRCRITYKNSGTEDLYNILMNVDGESIEKEQVSLGTLSAGKVNYTETYITFMDTGLENCNISFTYEDIKGNKYNTKAYKIAVQVNNEKMEEKKAVNETVKQQEENTVKSIIRLRIKQILLCFGIIFMTVVVILLYRKYKD